jgi:hypothetical protein
MSSVTDKLDQIIRNFHSNIVSFLDELIELFPSDADLILIRLLLKDTIPPTKIINTFIKEIIPNKESIKTRDDDFFMKSTLFDSFDKSKMNHLKILWKSTIIDDEDRQVIWKWFDTFVYLAEQYQKAKIH